MISLSDTIFSEFIGKLPIITVILVLDMYHTMVSIFVTVTETCELTVENMVFPCAGNWHGSYKIAQTSFEFTL